MRVQVRGPVGSWSYEAKDAFSVGRDPSCQIVLESDEVSRRHLYLSPKGEGWLIRDTSSNGSRLDGGALHQSASERCGPFRVEVGPFLLECSSPLHSEAELRRQVHERLLSRLRLDRLQALEQAPEERRGWVGSELESLVREELGEAGDAERVQSLARELCDEVLGLGPLESLLADEAVSEIMVVDPSTIYVERQGCIERSERSFSSDEAARAAIERIVTPLGRRIDESTPYVDARLADGSRVHAIIPPLALRGPCITIRKFRHQGLSIEELIDAGSASPAMLRFLLASVRRRKNIVISGGTGSGKTTTLNLLSSAIPHGERIVSIEDAAELDLRQEHVVSLEARPPNMEGKGAVSIRELLRNALRMRPDRIIVGECRGGETLDMLQAMNTGHEGSMTTTHASSPAQALSRLETLVLMSGVDLPLRAVRDCIYTSVDLIVQQERGADGVRRLTSIAELLPGSDARDAELRELFHYCRKRQRFASTGRVASYLPELLRAGECSPGELV